MALGVAFTDVFASLNSVRENAPGGLRRAIYILLQRNELGPSETYRNWWTTIGNVF